MATLPRVAVVGSINLDITAYVDRLPTPGETTAGGTLQRGIGGKGANQAVAASKLGGSVRMIGAVGDDTDGKWMREKIAEAGVGVDSIRMVSAATGTALIVVDQDAENQIAVCQGANDDVTIEGVDFAEDEVVLAQFEISMQLIERLAEVVPGYLALNAAPARALSATLLTRVDLFIVNETEYEQMPELAGAPLVAVTYGAAGAAMFEHGQEVARAAGVRAVAVNTVGAGDSFCAALVLALRSGATAQAALETACAVGAAAVAHHSSQPPFERLETYAPAS
ncbi:ribokinase (plasmid) [Coraliomargarita sp. W4R53]